MALALMDEPE